MRQIILRAQIQPAGPFQPGAYLYTHAEHLAKWHGIEE